MIENDKNKSIEWGIEPPGMGGWDEVEPSYEGPTIFETIKVGDHLTFGYCDIANGSVTTSRTEKVIKVKAGTNGTGHNGSVMVTINNMPHQISQATQISRAKYLNESGVLLKVPKDEGKYGFRDDFEQLITCAQADFFDFFAKPARIKELPEHIPNIPDRSSFMAVIGSIPRFFLVCYVFCFPFFVIFLDWN